MDIQWGNARRWLEDRPVNPGQSRETHRYPHSTDFIFTPCTSSSDGRGHGYSSQWGGRRAEHTGDTRHDTPADPREGADVGYTSNWVHYLDHLCRDAKSCCTGGDTSSPGRAAGYWPTASGYAPSSMTPGSRPCDHTGYDRTQPGVTQAPWGGPRPLAQHAPTHDTQPPRPSGYWVGQSGFPRTPRAQWERTATICWELTDILRDIIGVMQRHPGSTAHRWLAFLEWVIHQLLSQCLPCGLPDWPPGQPPCVGFQPTTQHQPGVDTGVDATPTSSVQPGRSQSSSRPTATTTETAPTGGSN